MSDDLDDAARAAEFDRGRVWGREAVARPDPMLFLISVPTEVRRNALVDQMIAYSIIMASSLLARRIW